MNCDGDSPFNKAHLYTVAEYEHDSIDQVVKVTILSACWQNKAGMS